MEGSQGGGFYIYDLILWFNNYTFQKHFRLYTELTW